MVTRQLRSIKYTIILIFFCCLMSLPFITFACSCATSPLPLSKQVKHFLANHPFHDGTIFLGKVIDVPIIGIKSTFTFTAEKWWHTPVNSEVYVKTNSSDAACGYPFVKGQTYLVFATKRNGNLWSTGLCTLTTDKPAPFLKILGEGQKPKPLPPAIDPLLLNLVGFAILIGAMFIAFLVSQHNEHRKHKHS